MSDNMACVCHLCAAPLSQLERSQADLFMAAFKDHNVWFRLQMDSAQRQKNKDNTTYHSRSST